MLAHVAGRARQGTGLVLHRGSSPSHVQRCRHHQAARLVSQEAAGHPMRDDAEATKAGGAHLMRNNTQEA